MMTQVANNMNIMIKNCTTLFLKFANVSWILWKIFQGQMLNYIKDCVISYEYKKTVIFFYEKIKTVVCDNHNHNFILFVIYLIVIITICNKLFSIYKNRERSILSRIKTALKVETLKMESSFAEKEKLLNNFKTNYQTKKDMRHSIDKMVLQCIELANFGKQLQNENKQVDQLQSFLLQKKLDDIELIMIDGSYNDPEFLSYGGKEWTLEKLKKKAAEMSIPAINLVDRSTLSYVLRITEQLFLIKDIVQPVYPNGYETQEMEDDSNPEELNEEIDVNEEEKEVEKKLYDEYDYNEYSSDPEWLPGKDEDSDEKIQDFMEKIVNTITNNVNKSSSCFFESKRSSGLEKLIKVNGMKFRYTHNPTPGYTLYLSKKSIVYQDQ